ncbi:methyl-accepting chemotaxis protein [Ammoniphilus resinae]|uniref:Methyl-accepting chemotaxis protein n=1 Tax=Ammoniphilus resinae TaxID=861532 RepID=A0ABS4GXT1_9BACL|nr:methyl-accepting chemotaxis protein [Ammoniphilus resinae]MBP1934675.1 methyl-accepting chemotaxis protein [Ammoniphilus resinae]
MKTRIRIFLSFGIIFLLILALGGYQFIQSDSQLQYLKEIKDRNLQSSLLADEMKLSVVQVQQFLSDISATRAQDGLDDGFVKAEEFHSLFTKDLNRLKEINPNEGEQLEAIRSSFETYYAFGKKMAQTYIDGGPEKGNQMMGEFDKVSMDIQKKVDTYQKDKIAAINTSIQNIEGLLAGNEQIFVIFVIAILFIAMLIAFLLSRSILVPLKKLEEATAIIANGDLRYEITLKSKDEFGNLAKSFEHMRKSLSHLIQKINFTSEHIASSTEELLAGVEQTKKATEHITGAIQEVALGSEKQVAYAIDSTQVVDEISKGMNEAASSVQSVADLSLTTNQKVTIGKKVVHDTIQQMNVAQNKVEATAEVIQILGEKSKSISQIVEIITQISNQTNLLALNAAIEAARAGELGKGFGIVADEVRKLAEQSNSAAGDIHHLIAQIQLEVTKAVDSMNEGTASVNDGIHMVFRTEETFNEMVGMIEEVSAQSQQVSSIIEQVNAGSHGMVEMIEGMASISKKASSNTQNVAEAIEEQDASMEEIKESVDTLNQMAIDLRNVVERFEL